MDSGWTILRGAGGFVAVHRANKWSTSVHLTQAQAELAAETLETRALAVLAERERERDGLRRALRGDDDANR